MYVSSQTYGSNTPPPEVTPPAPPTLVTFAIYCRKGRRFGELQAEQPSNLIRSSSGLKIPESYPMLRI